MVSLTQLFLIGIAYLLFLFGAAYLTEKGVIPRRIARHPFTHMLSIGVYTSVWTFYGAFDLAAQSGYIYLASYFGAGIAFILAPALLIPLVKITRTYQLSSLADLFAFRFRSGAIGSLTTLLLVIATLPMISIQIQTVSNALHQIHPQFSNPQISLVFCTILVLFSILFGARHVELRDQHSGLVVAMAVGSIIKLVALLVIASVAVWSVFGGVDQISLWLEQQPQLLEAMQDSASSDVWRTLLIGFFTAAIVMPHMFHMMFTENSGEDALFKASWGIPLILLVMAAVVPPILWAGLKLGATEHTELILLQLGILSQSPSLTIIAFVGGLSAASGITIVATVAMASMLQNHIVLPLIPTPDPNRFYSWIIWLRRLLIITLILASYLFYQFIGHFHSLHQLGIISIMAFLQFLPGLLATLFWQRTHKRGVSLGLIIGMGIWSVTLLAPLLHSPDSSIATLIIEGANWEQAAILSLLLNTFVLITASILSTQNNAEIQAANACLLNAITQGNSHNLMANSPQDYIELLTPRFGGQAAKQEVNRAMQSLSLDGRLLQSIDLMRLRNQLEHNLSGLIGPIEAATLLTPLDHPTENSNIYNHPRHSHILEIQLESYQEQLTGLAAELDKLRRVHRMTLQKLPTGVCTLDASQQISFWNREIERFTGIADSQAIGLTLNQLSSPWGDLLDQFAKSENLHADAQQLKIDNRHCWFSLHKAELFEHHQSGIVLLLEDETEYQLLQQTVAHNERLNSIGRFAAGIAHEIGNPVTAIACLAQNLKLETDNPEILETGELVVQQTQRINSIVQSLMRFAHSGSTRDSHIQHQVINLHELVAEAIQLVSLNSRGKLQLYINQVPPSLEIKAEPQQMLQVMVNLLNNACDASTDNDRIWIEAIASSENISISVIDEGCGIPLNLQNRLFEPFFTTKDLGEGTGLGLTLVYNIIVEHYGNIEVISPAKNKQKKGTQVVITLPAYSN